jgi:glycosyltransferase involved in cell wall biosynthesis
MASSSESDALISIAMPVLNCEHTLAMAIRSIILQSHRNWELLLIDDGSIDSTIRFAERFADPRIRIIQDGCHKGLPARLNQAIGAARGEFLARADGDDVSFPERLESQLQFLQTHKDVDLVGTDMLVFKQDGCVLGRRICGCTHREICRRPWAHFPLAHPTWMGRTEWFRRFGYSESAVRMEDQELLLRSWNVSRFAGIPEVLVAFREDSISLRKALAGRLNYVRAVRSKAHAGGRHWFWRAALGHGAKAIVDVIAVATGLKYRLLRSRARPATLDLAVAWQNLWSTLQHNEQ